MVISGVADRVPEKIASLVYLDAFVPESGQSSVSLLPPGAHLATVPGEDWLVAPIPSASFGFKRPEVIALWERKSGPHPLATLTQPLQLTGGIGRVKQKMYILGTDPARFTQFYDKVKNDAGWSVHTLPCTAAMQLEMPDELTAILLKAIPLEGVRRRGPGRTWTKLSVLQTGHASAPVVTSGSYSHSCRRCAGIAVAGKASRPFSAVRRTGRRGQHWGHEERFPRTKLSAGYGFRKKTIAGMRRNGRDAPEAVLYMPPDIVVPARRDPARSSLRTSWQD
jgi:hypothetical protein